MDAKIWPQVRALFELLVDLPQLARAEHLEQWLTREMAAQSPEERDALRAEVLKMLAADQQGALHTNMDALAPDLLSSLSEEDAFAKHQALGGLRVGPFCLLRELGRGGMGTVWLAERVDGEFEQQVAIKLIQPGWQAAETLTRFRAERQMLAGLKHPNIAHLIDGGLNSDGRPWLALEYVDGVDLRQYCSKNELTLTRRLELFRTVCNAVSYAHTRLIVHRDLKPSNLLVTHDGTVKLLDFGIAKLLAADTPQVSQLRTFTPEYAAPEQVRGEAITTRVDVYALGLLLYELITDRRPYQLQNSTPAAYERAILEQEPTRPSVVVTRAPESSVPNTGAISRAQMNQRSRQLRGDLDAIVLKALRKEPNERYGSVDELSADVGHYLENRPVLARRGGWHYRTTRFLRRHAMTIAASVVAVSALLGSLLVALHQRDLARTEAKKSEAVLEFMVDNFRAADLSTTNGEQITARELLDRGAQRMDASLLDAPEAKAQMQETIGRAYLGLGMYQKGLDLFESAIELRTREAEPIDLAYALLLKAGALKSLTRNEQSLATLAQARLLVAKSPDGEKAKKVQADVLGLSGLLHFLARHFPQARADLTQAIALTRTSGASQNTEWFNHSLMLSRVLASEKAFAEASTILNTTISDLRRAKPARTQLLAEALDALGASESKQGHFDLAAAAHLESARLNEQVLGPEHWYVAIALHNFGAALNDQAKFAEAIAPLERSRKIAQASLPAVHAFFPAVIRKIAVAKQGIGEFDQARDLLKELQSMLLAHPQLARDFNAQDVGPMIEANERARLAAGKGK